MIKTGMKRKQHIYTKKRYALPVLAAVVVSIYLVFAYNYFYFKQHHSHLPWPNNQHTYVFNDTAPSQKVYAALGDSLTSGFGAANYHDSYTYQVAEWLASTGQGVKLTDYSYPGDRTTDTLQVLDAVIASKPDVVTILIGTNDTHRLIQASDFVANYDQILHRLHTETAAKIYVINIPYLGGPSTTLLPFGYYYDAKIRAHNSNIKTLAQKYNVGYIDLYDQTVTEFKKDGPHYSKDAYHPSAAGYKTWADIVTHDISL
jgi:lysophospholipase L1-like esterase